MDGFNKDSTAEEVAGVLAGNIRGKTSTILQPFRVEEYPNLIRRNITVLITGVSPGGLGAETARVICRHQPGLVILAGRDLTKVGQTQEAIRGESPAVRTGLLELDLGVQADVRKAANELNGYKEEIDCLINNAGIMAVPFRLNPDGIESQFGTNHIGPFLFTNLIMEKLLAAKDGARVVNVSSAGHRRERIRFHDFNFEDGTSYDKWKAYGQSKTANMLFSVALADRLGRLGLRSFSLYPGRIPTNIAQGVTQAELKALG
ncbi:hypothetical protein LTR09_012820 [Extremus antarcticus]|uniref:Short-chain dehydrogenase n=1 Tax=Extremus antarcticus TaxID=702011 RepID=A0AAJ0D4K9_9PEZI|nr:hypothetical protein LTR09_012820 [Extremus antarcticus]